jgi:hypothetical protein
MCVASAFRRYYYRPYWLDAFRTAKPADMSWTRYVRKRAAAATGLHGFFSNSTLARALPSAVPLFNVSLPTFHVTMPSFNCKCSAGT